MASNSSLVHFQSDGTAEPFGLTVLRSGNPESHVTRLQPNQQTAVLCVDGEPPSRDVVRDALQDCELVVAPNGYEALRSINSHVFDLYILEYWLSDWSGVSLCRDIRKADPHVPICFCTAADQPDDRRRAERAGASAYLVKPLSPQVLYAETSTLLALSGRRIERARAAAALVIQQELERRLAALPYGPFSEQVEKALKRSVRMKARDAFLSAGGTVAGFERLWEALWIASCNPMP